MSKIREQNLSQELVKGSTSGNLLKGFSNQTISTQFLSTSSWKNGSVELAKSSSDVDLSLKASGELNKLRNLAGNFENYLKNSSTLHLTRAFARQAPITAAHRLNLATSNEPIPTSKPTFSSNKIS